MPRITNPKHELFAQELAKGKPQAEAYKLAGYEPSEQNASRLTRNDKVSARVAEIVAKAAERAEISVASVTEDLKRIARAAEQLGEASGLSVARAAAMDVAKLNGLIVEKKEVRTGSVLDDLPREALAELREMLLAERARRFYAAGDSRQSGEQANGCIH